MARTLPHWLCAFSLTLLLVVGSAAADDESDPAPTEEVAAPAAKEQPAKEQPAKEQPAPAKSDAENPAAAKPDGDGTPGEVLAGHSYHGEIFNQGPRQKAYLMGGTGKVNFPITTKDPLVQQFFNQGVGQLHGFWYFEAERSFRQAATLDPDCPMNYWGMAMANIDNAARSKGFITEAVKRKAGVGEREVMYIDMLDAYIKAGPAKNKDRSEAITKALERVLYKYPDDLEAKAFLALQLYKNKSASIPVSSYLAVDALLGEIFAAEPMHPAHHYRIHWWDNERAEKALASAALCGQAAPSIAHMWHMSGHIFSRLKRYEDAAWQQEASARVDHAHMMRDGVLPDRIHNFAHNNEWLIRDLSNVGRVRDGVDLAKNMIELPRHPQYNTLTKRGSTYYGRLRLFEMLNRYELWNEMIALCNTPYLEPTEDEAEQLKRLRLLGTAYYETGDIENGNAQLFELRERLVKLRKTQDEAGTTAEDKAKKEGKDEKAIEKAKADARRPLDTRVQNLQKAVHELEGRQAIADGNFKTGLALLTKAGGVDKLQLARARFLAGETDQAIKDVRAEVAAKKNEVHPQAILVDLLWRGEKKAEAIAAFKEMRELSRPIDIQSPVFARLAPVAKEMGLPDDWRLNKPLPTDIGDRPSLDSLGPFRWQPSPAPEWTLKDADGQEHSLKQFRGQPIVVIFYLGYGCLHCAEQLQAFGPMAKAFEAAGMPLVAISTDDQEGLKRSIEGYEVGPMPIQLLANADLDVFKSYRCYDDFEQQTLHGTFVIDGDGLVRWQDISYTPFMDPKFVLQEADRLLAQSRVTPSTTPTPVAAANVAPADAAAVKGQ
jgi:peroxiredoxin